MSKSIEKWTVAEVEIVAALADLEYSVVSTLGSRLRQ